jgi:septum formation topological specificity factor MinE
MNWLNTFLGRQQPTSREIAKNRLQLVLVQDRVNMSR